MQEEYSVELKSEEYNEIVGAIPPVIIRYGIGILFTVLLFAIILSTKMHYKTFIICSVYIERESSSTAGLCYKISFCLKPEDIAFIHKGQNATIQLLQYPYYSFGRLNIIIHPDDIRYITKGDLNYYV